MSNQIPIYLINLEERKDRLSNMVSRLNGLKFTRINALNKGLIEYTSEMEESNLSSTEIACIKSHIKALETFLASTSEMCCILEDDVIFGNRFFELVRSKFEFPKNSYVIKLETYKQNVRYANIKNKIEGSRLSCLHSVHYGTAAYLTSRLGANSIIKELKKYNLPADHIIFEEMIVAQNYGYAYQLNPACCIQEFLVNQIDDSNIKKSIKLKKDENIPAGKKQKIFRELNRILKKLSLLFSIFSDLLLCNGVFKKIEYRD
jgi:glycosyl transferase family 25